MSRIVLRSRARRRIAAALGGLVALGASGGCAGARGPDAAPGPVQEGDWPEASDAVLRTYGLLLGTQLAWIELDAEELARVQEGVRAAARGETLTPEARELVADVEAFREARLAAVGRRRRLATRSFLEEAAREPGATRLESGLVFTPLEPGSGEPPGLYDQVHIHYEGVLHDGTPYRSTRERAPEKYAFNNALECWKEALERMRPGGRARLVCPAELVYGDRGRPPRLPGGVPLVFDLELVRVDRVEDLIAEAEAREAAECGCDADAGSGSAAE